MNFIIDGGLVIPILCILIQNLLFIFIATMVLRTWGLLKKPLSGLEYSQALLGAVLLLAIVAIGNVSVQALYNTYMNYSGQATAWRRPLFVKYSQLFIITLMAEIILIGITWLTGKLFFHSSKSEDSINAGNLPLAMLMSGIVAGVALGIGKLLGLLLEGMTPHFAVFN